MTLYLQMDGVDDYVTIPNTFSYNRLVIDFMPVFKTGVIQYYWDSELTSPTTWIERTASNVDSYASNWFGGFTDGSGTKSQQSTVWFTNNARHTFDITGGAISNKISYVFTSRNLTNFLQGNIYDIKLYSSGTLVAHYDMSTGTVQDQSGNGRHATLNGGTFVDDGTGGGTPTPKDATADLKGIGSLTATGNREANVSAILTGTGSINVSALLLKDATANLVGVGVLNADATSTGGVTLVSASLIGQGLLNADAKRDVTVSVSLTGNGVLDASANVIVPEVKIKHVDLSFEIERELSLHFDLVSSIELSSEIEQTLALTFTI